MSFQNNSFFLLYFLKIIFNIINNIILSIKDLRESNNMLWDHSFSSRSFRIFGQIDGPFPAHVAHEKIHLMLSFPFLLNLPGLARERYRIWPLN